MKPAVTWHVVQHQLLARQSAPGTTAGAATSSTSPLQRLLVVHNRLRIARLFEGGIALFALLLALDCVHVRLLLLSLRAPDEEGVSRCCHCTPAHKAQGTQLNHQPCMWQRQLADSVAHM